MKSKRVNDRINRVGCCLIVTRNSAVVTDVARLLLYYCINARSLPICHDASDVGLLLQTLHDIMDDCSSVADDKTQE